MQKPVYVIMCLFLTCSLQAQTKVFKEISDDMSTQFKAITQDNALVGYLAFTRLEKVNADSFNYRLTIMDENLNDIGKVNFRQGNLELQTVSFEQNILCLGYIQSALAGGTAVRNMREMRAANDAAADNHMLIQFINLNGKIVNTYYREIYLKTAAFQERRSYTVKMFNYLKYGMQIRNIPNGGFCLFYGESAKQHLVLFDINGTMTQEQEVTDFADQYYLRATATNVYLLVKKNERVPEGGFKLYVYSPKTLAVENYFDLRDANDNWLKVLAFDNDPATGNAFIAGCIINPKMEKQFVTAFDYANGPYVGLFTLDLGGPEKQMHANCSYWENDKIPGLSGDGLFTDKDFFVRYASAFRDFKGNTIFAGTALALVGSSKFKLADGVFVRQEASGKVALDNNIACDETKSFGPASVVYDLDKKDYYKVVNPDTKNNYMIIDDAENIFIYNVDGKKIMRTIPHKDGSVKTNVYPAKEGHILVAEYNRKEKTTRFSIETP